ncbi:hypothetical protein KGP40_10650 [Weissella cibaria]|uniref:hypothetical protein n=1 Tax=Weissella cibaria TaxID=137591 RepID=UPI001C1FBF5B|nr:hypothetical protein [Weissella cibaria]MBU7562368.1 hypothetical protein [Weissella cibaria]
MKKPYLVNGKIYGSLKKISEDYPDIPYETIKYRNRQGKNGDELIAPYGFKIQGRVFGTLAKAAKHFDIPLSVLKSRWNNVNRGTTLVAPVSSLELPHRVEYKGKGYASIKEFAEKFDISVNRVRENKKHGRDLLDKNYDFSQSWGNRMNYLNGSPEMTNLIYKAVYHGIKKDLVYIGYTSNKQGVSARWSRHSYEGRAYLKSDEEHIQKHSLIINTVSWVDLIAAMTKPEDWDLKIIRFNVDREDFQIAENLLIMEVMDSYDRKQILNSTLDFDVNLTNTENLKLSTKYKLNINSSAKMAYAESHPDWKPVLDKYDERIHLAKTVMDQKRQLLKFEPDALKRNKLDKVYIKEWRDEVARINLERDVIDENWRGWQKWNFIKNQLIEVDHGVDYYVNRLLLEDANWLVDNAEKMNGININMQIYFDGGPRC